MKVLKKNFSSANPIKDDSFIQDKLTYSGYPETTKLIRLVYIDLKEAQLGRKSVVKVNEVPLTKFNIPEGVSLVDALKAVSFVYDQVSKKVDNKQNYLLTSQLTNHCLQQFSFTEIPETRRKKEKCLNLYFVGGNQKLFPATAQYDSYVDWYIPEVSRDTIKEIYKASNKTLPRSIKINYEPEVEPNEE